MKPDASLPGGEMCSWQMLATIALRGDTPLPNFAAIFRFAIRFDPALIDTGPAFGAGLAIYAEGPHSPGVEARSKNAVLVPQKKTFRKKYRAGKKVGSRPVRKQKAVEI